MDPRRSQDSHEVRCAMMAAQERTSPEVRVGARCRPHAAQINFTSAAPLSPLCFVSFVGKRVVEARCSWHRLHYAQA
jgi:hypothetical protein